MKFDRTRLPTDEVIVEHQTSPEVAAYVQKLKEWEADETISPAAAAEAAAIASGVGITDFHLTNSTEREFLTKHAQRMNVQAVAKLGKRSHGA